MELGVWLGLFELPYLNSFSFYSQRFRSGRILTKICLFPFNFISKVIGDKKGGGTAYALMNHSQLSVLEEIQEVLQVPMKFIHVIRNPFDNIATMMLRSTNSRDAVTKVGCKPVKRGGGGGLLSSLIPTIDYTGCSPGRAISFRQEVHNRLGISRD